MTNIVPKLSLQEVGFRVLPMRTRFPFKYGIASLTALPHLILEAVVEVDGVATRGIASEGLPPKWFTKSPDTTFEQDLPAMLEVIENAVKVAKDVAPNTFFNLWRNVYEEQSSWAEDKGHPPLLANLGVSLVERVILDSLCRKLKKTIHEIIHQNLLGLRLREVRPELRSIDPIDFLPTVPLGFIQVRHTIGLGDPLTPVDVNEENRADDSLPLDLESCIREYKLKYFKIKICGLLEKDLPRLQAIAEILPQGSRFTLDGNEQYESIAAFREHWEAWRENKTIRQFLDASLLLVEQPAHRDETFASDVTDDFSDWSERPSFIIDEADGSLDSLPNALALGYDGASHKNCKGILKGIANAATLNHARALRERPVHLSGEDLANVGPIALLQDLSIMATLGVKHVERNGHHYFKGLSAWPESIQESLLSHHGFLYRAHPDGYPTLCIDGGKVDLTSLNTSAFGPKPKLNFDDLSKVDVANPETFIALGLPNEK